MWSHVIVGHLGLQLQLSIERRWFELLLTPFFLNGVFFFFAQRIPCIAHSTTCMARSALYSAKHFFSWRAIQLVSRSATCHLFSVDYISRSSVLPFFKQANNIHIHLPVLFTQKESDILDRGWIF